MGSPALSTCLLIRCWSLSDMSFGCQLMLWPEAESGRFVGHVEIDVFARTNLRQKGLMDDVDRVNDWVTFEVPSPRKCPDIFAVGRVATWAICAFQFLRTAADNC